MLSSMAIAIPTGVKILNWVATLFRGSIVLRTPLYFAAGFLVLFTLGGITGVMLAIFPIDRQVTDTYFVVAHFHFVLVAGSVSAVMAALYYWFPKITGRFLSERIGKLSFWLQFIGFLATFLIQHSLGLSGMPRRISSYHANTGWGAGQPDLHGRRVHPRRRRRAHRRERPLEPAPRPAGRLGPVEGQHARVVRDLAAAAAQLRRRPDRAIRRTHARHPSADPHCRPRGRCRAGDRRGASKSRARRRGC